MEGVLKMILKALRKNGAVTINYYKNGLLQTFKGKIQRLDLTDQTLSLKDEQQNTFSIRLSGIKEIY
ncbi:YolD-like family protein [Priestia aryabhattai]|uniref:YolD-like family protein n=1 Tax=Priestia aryabhattai TaxID=412384 RepID=UPI0028A0A009